MVDYYAAIIEILLEKCFFEKGQLSKEEALDKITNNYFFPGKYKATKDTCITSFGIKEAFEKIFIV